MDTTTCLPVAISLRRPWWQRLWGDLRAAAARRRAREDERACYAAIAHLSEAMLRDIGAPDWMHERERSSRLAELGLLRH